MKYKKRRTINVYVLMGGPSAEYDISIRTAQMVIKNLNHKKFRIIPILITKTGRWLVSPEYKKIIKESSDNNLNSVIAHERKKSIPLKSTLNSKNPQEVAFIAMHGPYGEDGTIQGLLELAGIPYTGSGISASALAMDKVLSAKLLCSQGIAIPEFISFDKTEWRKNKKSIIAAIKKLGLPTVIKPSNLGSSVGVTIIKNYSNLKKAVRLAFSYSPRIMAQEYIKGREVTCAVIDKGIPGTEMALLPTEIIPKRSSFFDYTAKYTPGASEEITPPSLPKPIIKKIQKTALLCHKALGCSGMSRTDMILYSSPTKSKPKLYVLEVNTIPGMTETSLLPQAAKACGISFPKLLEQIIVAALNRYKRSRLT